MADRVSLVPSGASQSGAARGGPFASATAAFPRRISPSPRGLNPYLRGPKQALECALVVLSSPAWASLLAFIFLLLLIPLRGRVLLSQTRTGRNGRFFRMYKFRTLRSAVSTPLSKPEASAVRETVFLGGWLRRTGLDELPQLVNVLKGDMHVVGPRPLLERDLGHLTDEEAAGRQAIRPGLTGLWQVTRRYDDSDARFAEVDREYIRTATAMLDLRILLLTMAYAFRMRGR